MPSVTSAIVRSASLRARSRAASSWMSIVGLKRLKFRPLPTPAARHDVLVEHREAPRIDRIERRVRAVRLVQNREEPLPVVELAQHEPVLLASIGRELEPGRLHSFQPLPCGDRRRAGRGRGPLLAGDRAAEHVARPEAAPAIRDRDHCLALFANRSEMAHECFQCVECLDLAARQNHLLRDQPIACDPGRRALSGPVGTPTRGSAR